MSCTNICIKFDTDALTIIHPCDENSMSDQNKHDMRQYMHGGVNISGQKSSVGFVFRVVNAIGMYHLSDDTMEFNNSNGNGDDVNGMLGIDLALFDRNVSTLYRNTLH